jgi:hypothetical protein
MHRLRNLCISPGNLCKLTSEYCNLIHFYCILPTRIKCRSQFRHQLPKTTTELRITCLSPAPGADGMCGKAVVWFDYELGEKNHMGGFVCDDHWVSNRVEKLAQPPASVA